MKKFIDGFCGGITIGLFFSIFASLIVNDGNYYPTNSTTVLGKYYFENFTNVQVLIISIIIWVILGLIGSYSGIIFDNLNDKSNMKSAAVKHYLIMILTFVPLSLAAGWYDFDIMMIIFVIISYTSLYILIYKYIEKKVLKEIYDINSVIKNKN